MSAGLRVSVVMPSYNHARFIRTAIESVLDQDYDPVLLLVMDGGSTDGSLDILRSYGDRISFISQRDRGQSDAINQGMRRATGDIACWLNSDDVLTPHAIRTAVDAFERHPDVSFVYGRGWNANEAGDIIGDSGVLPFDLWRLIHQRNFIQQPSCFFRASLLEKVGFLDEGLHYVMDWELWIRFSSHKGLYIDDYLSCNRIYGDNKTQSGQWRRWREIRDMIRRYTTARWPPTLALYFLEAMIQSLRAQRWNRNFDGPLANAFSWGMKRDMSGRYADGGVEQVFHVSVWRPSERSPEITVWMTPLSRFDTSYMGREPIVIRWTSPTGDSGAFSLEENGRAQQFRLVLARSAACPVVHFRFRADHRGHVVAAGTGLPRRRIIGFVDSIGVADGGGQHDGQAPGPGAAR
jgi:glycosyltransferase involved in cell wall biosynthesis